MSFFAFSVFKVLYRKRFLFLQDLLDFVEWKECLIWEDLELTEWEVGEHCSHTLISLLIFIY